MSHFGILTLPARKRTVPSEKIIVRKPTLSLSFYKRRSVSARRCFGFQPRMFRALSPEAMRVLGSPGLLAAALTFMSLSVTCRAASAISDTENPLLNKRTYRKSLRQHGIGIGIIQTDTRTNEMEAAVIDVFESVAGFLKESTVLGRRLHFICPCIRLDDADANSMLTQ